MHPGKARRMADDRGTTLLEAAVIAPILLVIVLGIMEFGMIFRDYLTINDVVSDGARIGAIQGNKPMVTPAGANPDYGIVQRIREGTSAIPVSSIERIVIFRAGPSSQGSPLQQVPEACKSGTNGVNGECSVFADVNQAYIAVQNSNDAYFSCTTGESCWAASERNDGPNPNEIDYLGVYVKIEKEYVSKMFGDTIELQAASIFRLEPGPLVEAP